MLANEFIKTVPLNIDWNSEAESPEEEINLQVIPNELRPVGVQKISTTDSTMLLWWQTEGWCEHQQAVVDELLRYFLVFAKKYQLIDVVELHLWITCVNNQDLSFKTRLLFSGTSEYQ